MKKKLLLLVLSVIAAMAVAPAAASATPWHTNSTGAFTLHGGKVAWSTASAITVECTTVTGAGNYSATTGGTITLALSGCTSIILGMPIVCTTLGQPNGTITSTTLRLDNVMLGVGKPGVLLTPNAETGAVSHFSCGALTLTFEGNGLLGTVTAPACGASSTTGTWSFSATAHGAQQHTLYTGTVYSWKKGAENIAFNMEATVNLAGSRTVTCT